jgi:hypothetical protein
MKIEFIIPKLHAADSNPITPTNTSYFFSGHFRKRLDSNPKQMENI